MFALTNEKNKFEVMSKDFLQSCTRYGLDSPFPYIKLHAETTSITTKDKSYM